MRFSGLWTSEEFVVQSTCLRLIQEITGAKPVRDANLHCPQSIFSDALHWYWRFSSVQFRVGAPTWQPSQSSQRSGRFHTPAVPRAALGTATSLRLGATERQASLRSSSFDSAGQSTPPRSSLRISFVKNSCRGSTDWRLQFARVVQQKRHDVESVVSAGANPAASTILRPASIKVMQRTFNPLNRERYPGGPPFPNGVLG